MKYEAPRLQDDHETLQKGFTSSQDAASTPRQEMTYYAKMSGMGGVTIYREGFGKTWSCYLQPGDEANKFWDEYDNAPTPESQESMCAEYNEVMDEEIDYDDSWELGY